MASLGAKEEFFSEEDEDSDNKSSPTPPPIFSGEYDWPDKKFLHFKRAWEFTGSRGEGVIIGHPDSGYHFHPEIISSILIARSVNFVNKEREAIDPLRGPMPGHGTLTASILSSPPGKQFDIFLPTPQNAKVNNRTPYCEGIAPGAKIISYRVNREGGVIHFAFIRLSRAIRRAIRDGVQVISMSLGGPFPLPWLGRAIRAADRQGIIMVAAAGNQIPKFLFNRAVVWPARYPQVVATAASDSEGKVWNRSSEGRLVDITAPGVSIWSAKTEQNKGGIIRHPVRPRTGTSLSTAYTAGAAALFLSHHGHEHLKSVYGKENIGRLFKYMLKNHAYNRPEGWNTKKHGSGILDVYKLVSAPLPDPVILAENVRTQKSLDGWESIEFF